MTFRKLALASAIAMAPTVGFSAMVEMADTAMSDVTGQDGIEMDIATTGITTTLYVHDKDGLSAMTSPTYTFDGAIVVTGFSYAGNINIDIDAGDVSVSNGSPTLNINVSIPTATIITGAISVANSQRDDGTAAWGINTQTGTILNTMTIALAGLVVNLQLGNEPQGNMISIASTITGGLTIGSFALNDAGGAFSGGAIGASLITVLDTGGGPNLTLSVKADATTAGLRLNLAQVGTALGGMDMRIENQYLGTTGAGIIGDITVVGLNVNNTIVTVSGK